MAKPRNTSRPPKARELPDEPSSPKRRKTQLNTRVKVDASASTAKQGQSAHHPASQDVSPQVVADSIALSAAVTSSSAPKRKRGPGAQALPSHVASLASDQDAAMDLDPMPSVGSSSRSSKAAPPAKDARRPKAAPRTKKAAPTKKDPPSDDNPSDDDSSAKASGKFKGGMNLDLPPMNRLRAIIDDMTQNARPGLDHFVNAKRTFYIRVGTICSGTDAPIHVMKLFRMLTDVPGGEPIFETINEFACEIEPYKQGFIQRNSAPKLLFRDATNFADLASDEAYLVSGAKVKIPKVDMFIAGTACVDFSKLNPQQTKDFEGADKLDPMVKRFETLKAKKEGELRQEDMPPDDWELMIKTLTQDPKKKSSLTFAAALVYMKKYQPKIAIFENVMGAPWKKWIEIFLPLLGYAAVFMNLDTKDFYLPQTRSRKYLFCFSHSFFGFDKALALCDSVRSMVTKLKRNVSSPLTEFTLPPNSLILHRARNEMDHSAQKARDADNEWTLSKARHVKYRRDHNLGDDRPYLKWKETGLSKPRDKVWRPWEAKERNRVKDLLECVYLAATKGELDKKPAFDPSFKTYMVDTSQNVDRVDYRGEFGITPCITPNMGMYLFMHGRPIIGYEALKLQGIPVESMKMSVETQAQLQNLAGNAMTTTVVGAAILGSLMAVNEKVDEEIIHGMFPQRDYQITPKEKSSFQILGPAEANGLQRVGNFNLAAFSIASVQTILDLGSKTRIRCVCRHILSYSSIELYNCKNCGASRCKSCKGNPPHAMVPGPSFIATQSVHQAEAQRLLRAFFPPILPMRASPESDCETTITALLKKTQPPKPSVKAAAPESIAKAIITGLTDTIYEQVFIECNEATRVEYQGDKSFSLRAIIEAERIVWYLLVIRFSDVGNTLGSRFDYDQPIARAVLGADAVSQIPTDQWEIWCPKKVAFDFTIESLPTPEKDLKDIRVRNFVGPQNISASADKILKSFEGCEWTSHPECGFAEEALWTARNHPGDEKLYLFKDVEPTTRADKDMFVISTCNREMGMLFPHETRPVVLRIDAAKTQNIHNPDFQQNGPTEVKAHLPGWWQKIERNKTWSAKTDVRQQSDSAVLHVRRPFDEQPHSQLPKHGSKQADCHFPQILMDVKLPILGKKSEDLGKTLANLHVEDQLDFDECARLLNPALSAVERAIVETHGRAYVLWKDVELLGSCGTCMPMFPPVCWRLKPKGIKKDKNNELPAAGSDRIEPFHTDEDLKSYSDAFTTKPNPFSFEVKTDLDKLTVEVRFSARAHALLHQAVADLPFHATYHNDPDKFMGTVGMAVEVVHDHNLGLEAFAIPEPDKALYETVEDKPNGFLKTLHPAQRPSLAWMLHRENFGYHGADGTLVAPHADDTFTEREIAEVHNEQLRFRLFAYAEREVSRHGGVLADGVGFGKTAVCLALIAKQQWMDKNVFHAQRSRLSGQLHVEASLIIVPNQLTKQWETEVLRFIGKVKVIVIEDYKAFQDVKVADIKAARIVIVSNKVFDEPKYISDLSEFCGLAKVNFANAVGTKAYRAFYNEVQRNLCNVHAELTAWYENPSDANFDALRAMLNCCHSKREGNGISLAQRGDVIKVPKLFEGFSWSRIIWDEFSYMKAGVTEFVAHALVSSKWLLSGTPTLVNLEDVAKIAYLFNVHVARPMLLVDGRQPSVANFPPEAPLTSLETKTNYETMYSHYLLNERNQQGVQFVSKYIRKSQVLPADIPTKVESVIVASTTLTSRMLYLETEAELTGYSFNANQVPTEARRRLMGRVDWSGSRVGRVRASEALMLRAGLSPSDALQVYQNQCRNMNESEIANHFYTVRNNLIKSLEDRGMELWGKSLFLAQKMLIISITHMGKKEAGQEDRQDNYYKIIVDFKERIFSPEKAEDHKFGNWAAYKSALRMVIPDKKLHTYLEPTTSRPKDFTGKTVEQYWHQWSAPSTVVPKCKNDMTGWSDTRKKQYAERLERLKIFQDWYSRSPLHSSRWYRDEFGTTVKRYVPPVPVPVTKAKSKGAKSAAEGAEADDPEAEDPEAEDPEAEDVEAEDAEAEYAEVEDAGEQETDEPEAEAVNQDEETVTEDEAELQKFEILTQEFSWKLRLEDEWRGKNDDKDGEVVPVRELSTVHENRYIEDKPAAEHPGYRPIPSKDYLQDQRARYDRKRAIALYRAHRLIEDPDVNALGELRDPPTAGYRSILRKEFNTDSKSTKNWNSECNRRGLKSNWKKPFAEHCLARHVMGLSEDSDFVSSDRPLLTVEDEYPKKKVIKLRGTTMEKTFDRFSAAADELTGISERLSLLHANKDFLRHYSAVNNLTTAWTCSTTGCPHPTDLEKHYLSMVCGHVHCRKPDQLRCGISECQEYIEQQVVQLAKLTSSNLRALNYAGFGTTNKIENPTAYVTEARKLSAKILAMIQIIQRLAEEEQVVIFAQDHTSIDELYDALEKFGISHIKKDALKKHEARELESFKQENGPKVLVQQLASEQAAGSNLHAANHIFFMTPLVVETQQEWESHMTQAQGRCVRQRQQKTVYITHFVTDSTFEVDVLEWRKRQEIVVEPGQALGSFTDFSTTAEFMERFQEGTNNMDPGMEKRAISLINRPDVMFMQGDGNYVTVAEASKMASRAAAPAAAAPAVAAPAAVAPPAANTDPDNDVEMPDVDPAPIAPSSSQTVAPLTTTTQPLATTTQPLATTTQPATQPPATAVTLPPTTATQPPAAVQQWPVLRSRPLTPDEMWVLTKELYEDEEDW